MHTYNRNGVQIEQCSGCRGVFLDYGELEALTRMESQWAPPPPPGPAWGAPHADYGHGHGHYGHHRHNSFVHMLFSS
jgi:Zn-finger nucleic acid-binding protein